MILFSDRCLSSQVGFQMDFNLIEDQQTNSYVKFGSVVPMVSDDSLYLTRQLFRKFIFKLRNREIN